MKEHAARLDLAVPTPVTSVATTPELETKLDSEPKHYQPESYHNQKYLYRHHIAHAANALLAVPTPVVSVATTPALETKLVSETTLPVLP